MVRVITSLGLMLALGVGTVPAHAASWHRVVDSASTFPGLGGPGFIELPAPASCSAGVAFLVFFQGADHLYLAKPNGTLTPLALDGAVVPGVGTLRDIREPVCDRQRVLFAAQLEETRRSVLMAWENGALRRIVGVDALPASEGSMAGLGRMVPLGDAVAFGSTRLPPGGADYLDGLWQHDAGGLRHIAEDGETAAGARHPFRNLGSPVGFGQEFAFNAFGPFPEEGIYQGTSSSVRALFESGDGLPEDPSAQWLGFRYLAAEGPDLYFVGSFARDHQVGMSLFHYGPEGLEHVIRVGDPAPTGGTIQAVANVTFADGLLAYGFQDDRQLLHFAVRDRERHLAALSMLGELDGRTIISIAGSTGRGGPVARIGFSDRTHAIFRLEVSAVEIPTLDAVGLVFFALLLMMAAGRRLSTH